MKSTLKNKKLGDYIHQVDIRNKNLEVQTLLGVSNEKYFMPSIANIVGTDLSSYKIVKYNQFAYGTVTSRNGDKISIALLKEKECIVSSSYIVFEINDINELNPDYLMMWFKRPEFDRYSRCMSHGSVRELFGWEKLCEVELPIPTIKEQLKIVEDYKVIEERIAIKEAINNNLSDEIDLIFREKIIRSSADITLLTEFLTFERGVEPGSSSYETEKSVNNIQFFRVQDILNVESKIFINKAITKNRIANISDILVSFDGSVGKIGFGINGAYSSGMQKISSKFNEFSSAIIYAIFHSNDIQMELGKSTGTTIAHASKFITILSLPFDLALYKEVQILIEPFFNQMLTNKLEINNLKNIQSLILEKISLTEQ